MIYICTILLNLKAVIVGKLDLISITFIILASTCTFVGIILQ